MDRAKPIPFQPTSSITCTSTCSGSTNIPTSISSSSVFSRRASSSYCQTSSFSMSKRKRTASKEKVVPERTANRASLITTTTTSTDLGTTESAVYQTSSSKSPLKRRKTSHDATLRHLSFLQPVQNYRKRKDGRRGGIFVSTDDHTEALMFNLAATTMGDGGSDLPWGGGGGGGGGGSGGGGSNQDVDDRMDFSVATPRTSLDDTSSDNPNSHSSSSITSNTQDVDDRMDLSGTSPRATTGTNTTTEIDPSPIEF